MKLILLPLAIVLGYYGYQERDRIADQYTAAYPADPAKNAAIAQCALQPNFNRLDTDDRKHCYRQVLGREPGSLVPTPAPTYAFNPSHLPGDDIRRAEANQSFHLIGTASAAPMPAPAPVHAVAVVVPAPAPRALYQPVQARIAAYVAKQHPYLVH